MCDTHPDARTFTADEVPHIVARAIMAKGTGYHAHQLKGVGWMTCNGA